jgi:hypothetical protein
MKARRKAKGFLVALAIFIVAGAVSWYHLAGRWSYNDYYDKLFISFGTPYTESSYKDSKFTLMHVSNRHMLTSELSRPIPGNCEVIIHHDNKSVRAADVGRRELEEWQAELIGTYLGRSLYRVPEIGEFELQDDVIRSIRLRPGVRISVGEHDAFSLPLTVREVHAMLGKPNDHSRFREPMLRY